MTENICADCYKEKANNYDDGRFLCDHCYDCLAFKIKFNAGLNIHDRNCINCKCDLDNAEIHLTRRLKNRFANNDLIHYCFNCVIKCLHEDILKNMLKENKKIRWYDISDNVNHRIEQYLMNCLDLNIEEYFYIRELLITKDDFNTIEFIKYKENNERMQTRHYMKKRLS